MPTSSARYARWWLSSIITLALLLGGTVMVHASSVDATRSEQITLPGSRGAGNTDSAGEGEGVVEEEAVESSAIADLEDVVQAVVQIEAIGTFVDPVEGLLTDVAGRGSGFIIDESGIAVTNNHVVTGGALFKVYVEGQDEPLNARVLGVAECADLAVIDIQGSGFPYLEWYEGRIRVGLDVYAAGFPLGDPEFTLTRGIVAKARAGGESSWASVDAVLQHDADLNPGNSGGPLVDEEGKVVGVNYRRNDAEQFFAISRDEAQPLIAELRAGNDVDSIGINGEAFSDGEGSSGIWISSVKTGSIADKAGIQSGDIMLSLEGVTLATDGTMETYCDILRSHTPEDVLAVEVARLSTEEVLEGRLNGRALEPRYSFADELQGTTDDDQSSADSDPELDAEKDSTDVEYMGITDEQGILEVEVPVEWSDVLEKPWENDEGQFGIILYASPDIDRFFDEWGVPGVAFSYSDQLIEGITPDDLLDPIDYSESCTYVGRSELAEEGFYRGAYDEYEDCGDSKSLTRIFGLLPESNDFILRIETYAATDADVEALGRTLDTFYVTPPAEFESEFSTSSGLGDTSAGESSAESYEVDVVDDPAITALAPTAWSDTTSGDWELDDGEIIGVYFGASTDLDDFYANWVTPGFLAYTATDLDEPFDPVDGLDGVDFSETCDYDDRVKHEHSIFGITYAGVYDIWVNCDGDDNFYVVLSAASDPMDHALFIYFLGTSDADIEALDTLINSFYVVTDITAPIIEAALSEEDLKETVDDYMTIAGDEGSVAVDVPTRWSDVVSEDWIVDGDTMGRSLLATPDAAGFNDTWSTPGVFVGVSEILGERLTTEEVVDILKFSEECDYDDRYDYATDAFTGMYDIWTECDGEEGQVFIVLAINPTDDDDLLALVYVNLISDADLAAFEQVMETLVVARPGETAEVRTSAVAPSATIVTSALNVRSGPGTNYSRVGAVKRSDELDVAGQYNDCSWLLIFTPTGQPGWISGNNQYSALNTACVNIPEVDAPEAQSGNAATADGSTAANAGQGCYAFDNQLGAELTITFTNRNTGQGLTLSVAPNSVKRQCFDPAPYTYTLDAPPPWGSTNGELSINAGDNLTFPIYGE